MYNSRSINDGIEFINQSNVRISETQNKVKKNKYKTESKNGLVLETDTVEGFEINDEALNAKNNAELSEMNTNIALYDTKLNALQTSINSITTQSKTFLNANGESSLKNKDIKIADGQYGRVNNAGVFKLYPSGFLRCGIPETPVSTGINLVSRDDPTNPFPLLSDPNNASNVALYGSDMARGSNNMLPCSNFAGTNIYVSQPINFSYNTDMVYGGAFQNSSSPALVKQDDMSEVTVKQCVTRAMDRGFSVAALNNYNSSTKKGNCWIGNGTVMNGNVQNNFKEIKYPESIFNATGSRTHVTFAADGGLYAGSSSNKFEVSILPAAQKVPVADLHPLYGGTISDIGASYFGQSITWWSIMSSWNNLITFNYNPIGTPGGQLDSIRLNTYIKPVFNTITKKWESSTETIASTVTRLQSSSGTDKVLISYKCGKKPAQSLNQAGVSIGSTFNIDCWDLYNKYPSFKLNLSDDGIITITNNSNDKTTGGIQWTSPNPPISVPLKMLANGASFNPRAPRTDWVSGSINNGGDLLSYSNSTPSLLNGEWISSPLGLCRLKYDRTAGRLILEYSVYDVELDPDNNLIGVGNGFSKYDLKTVDDALVKGNVAYIDIDNGLHKYADANMLGFDSTYSPMAGFLPSGNATTISSDNLTNEAKCATLCSSKDNCAGYTFLGGTCKTYEDTKIYPKGDRIMILGSDNKTLDTTVKTQIRNRIIKNSHDSCNKVVNNTNSSIYKSYPTTSDMSISQKCALGLVLSAQMSDLRSKNGEAITEGTKIKNKIKSVYTLQNNLKDTMNNKSTEIVSKLEEHEINKKKIDKYIDSNNTTKAVVTDTELLLISDNYKYAIWGIITILISMAAIKTFRNASL
jgi:hypothetical protein